MQAIELARIPLADGQPIIDRRAILEIFEFPNREEILARMGDGGAPEMGGQMQGGGVPGGAPSP